MAEKQMKSGWQTWRFDQMATNVNARIDDPSESGMEHYVGLEHLDSDSLRIRRWGSPEDVEATKLCFNAGDIIFGRRRAYLRKLGVAEFNGICSAHAMVLRPKVDVVLPEFLPFFMQSDLFMNRAVEISVGSLSPTINWKTMAAQAFALPSIEEQRRVVAVLSAIENCLDELRTAAEHGVELFRSAHAGYFQNVLLGRRDTDLSEVLQSISEKNFSGIPILSVTIDGRVVRRDSLERHVSDDTGEEKYLRVRPGDLVYNTMRLWQGAIGIVQEEGLISPAYTVLRAQQPDFSPYFWYLLRSPTLIAEYRRFVRGVAKDRWRIYYADLCKLRLNLPPAEERFEIAKELDKITNSVRAPSKREQQLLFVKKALMAEILGSGDV